MVTIHVESMRMIFCLVSTPDLLQYAPNGKWLPNAIDVDKIKLISKKSAKEQQYNTSSSLPALQDV